MLSISHAELSRRLAAAQLGGLTAHIWAAAEELRGQKATTGAALSQKFANEGGTFQMAFGSLSTFFGGLEGQIGPPKMIDGSLKEGMRSEHCEQPDSQLAFKTSNGFEGVTSELEWEFVTEPKEDKVYAERGGRFKEEHPDWCRKAVSLQTYKVQMDEVNLKLAKAGHTLMILEELLGGRLYTGVCE